MRIAIFTDAFEPQISGVVTATKNLVLGLAKQGHKVILITPKYPTKKLKKVKKSNNKTTKDKIILHKNITIVRLSSVPAMFYPGFRFVIPSEKKIIRLLKEEKIEVIHFVTPMILGLLAIRCAKKLKLPLVTTFHTFIADSEYLKHIKMDFQVTKKLTWKYLNYFNNKCDLVTSPSEKTRKELIKHGCIAQVKTISNGIDFSIFDNASSLKFKKKHGLAGHLLLFIGRIAHEKNILELLEIISIVSKKIKNVKLLIVGDGPQINDVTNKISQLNLSPNIILLGKVKHDELTKSGIFGASKIFVTASKTENQPMTVLESQANGLVCVCYNSKGMPDLITNNKNGFLVKEGNKKAFANAIIKLIQNQKVYTKMKKNTIKEIKKHSLDQVINEWEYTYQKLIKTSRQKQTR